MLHIQGRAEILWQSPGEGRVERYWTVEPERILRLRQLLPATGTDVEYAVSTGDDTDFQEHITINVQRQQRIYRSTIPTSVINNLRMFSGAKSAFEP
ncbi:hypothetical protein [Erwinia sp. MYb535]|uniref:hypothetical protein n=1 Tax=Erwinia sp. MYb535 TaxID=2745309 RepID=UPI0030A857A9